MSNQRWTSDEEFKLITLYSNNKDIKNISNQLNRSESAVQMRLEKIIFDNVAKGKTAGSLAKTLKTDEGNVTQMFYTHKSFKQKGGENVDGIIINTVNPSNNHTNQTNQTNQVNQINNETKNQLSLIDNKSINTNTNITSTKQKGGVENRLNAIENENKLLKAIIDNHNLRKEIAKLYKQNKLDKNSKKLYKHVVGKL